MDQIKVLEEIGLKKVSQETHIEEKYIKYMVDCDFDKLNRINTLGFIKILSREYKLNLDSWTEVFEEYWLENRKDEEADGLFIVVEDRKSSRKLLFFILIIILVATLSLLFSLFKDKIALEDYIQTSESTYEQTASVQEAQKSLKEVNEFKNSLAEQAVVVDSNKTEEEVSGLGVAKEIISEDFVEDTNKTQEIIEVKAESEFEKNETDVLNFEKEAIFISDTELWIGVIYLDNFKKRSFLGDGNYSINLSRDQIITTGHGSFSLSINEEEKEFKRKVPIKLLVRDGKISEINTSEFEELNRGNPW